MASVSPWAWSVIALEPLPTASFPWYEPATATFPN